MDKPWPPLSVNPRDPDFMSVKEAAYAARTTEKAIRENIAHFGVFWFGRWYVSRERLLSTAWSKPAKKQKTDPEQENLGF